MREPETQRLELAFPDFVQCAQQWRARRVFLRVSAQPHVMLKLLCRHQGCLPLGLQFEGGAKKIDNV